MKTFILIALAALSVQASSAFAEGLPAGSYQCQKSDSDQTPAGAFYIRADGTSKKVQVLSAHSHENGSGVEGCYRVSFKWTSNGTAVSGAYCCPYGAN